MDQAQQQGKGLRLKLHVKPPNLTVLPWEFLYDPDRDEYLCFSRDTPIVRYTDLRQAVGRLTVEPPLRILGMVASPRDLDPLDVEHEKSLMDEAIEDLQADGFVKLTWLEGETWRDLQRAMRRDGPWHIFHFVGHGDFDMAAQEGLIAFTEKGTGRRHLLRSRDLARLLDGHPSLRLVFLNSCEGARGSEGDPFSGTAATLVRRGIPAVVAMQYQITDQAAIEFSSAFYESLADGLPVDAAVTEARVAVSMDSMLEWGTPVLYMRSPDGRLFDISTDTRPSEQSLGITSQEEILERQEQADKEIERRSRLDELYDRARRSHQNHDWQEVIGVFEQIRAEDPGYPDSEGLLASARESMEAQEHARRTAAIYAEGQRHMNTKEWQQALECFEEVQRLEPGFRETEELLSRVRRELAPPPTIGVPDLSGQAVSQARNTLVGEGLQLRVQKERPSDTVPEGQIIGQSPGAGREVQLGTSVSVTVSLGPSTARVPNLRGKLHDEARNILDAAGLRLGTVGKVPSDEVAENKIVKHYPTAGSKVERGTSVRVTVAAVRQNEELALEEGPKRRSYPKPDTLPDESELEREVESSSQRSNKLPSDRGRKSEKPQDLPD